MLERNGSIFHCGLSIYAKLFRSLISSNFGVAFQRLPGGGGGSAATNFSERRHPTLVEPVKRVAKEHKMSRTRRVGTRAVPAWRAEAAVPLTNCVLILLDLDTGRLENRIVPAVPV